MDRDRRIERDRRRDREEEPTQEAGPETPSPLLDAARGWAGSAREAMGRLHTDDAREFLETARRNGPGQ
jgi:hypothetical protein